MPGVLTKRQLPQHVVLIASTLAVVALTALTLGVWLRFHTYPAYDTQYGLLWGRELFDGGLPGFDDYRAPTQHPLLVAVGLVLAPLGFDAAGRVVVLLCFAALVALVVAMARIGWRIGGPLGALVAAGLTVSRLNLWLLAANGFLDVPYCALIAWALLLELERPRRGGAVWVLLAVAGLLRPEAWLLAAAYAVWVAWGRTRPAWLGAIAAAATAPLLWCATDLAVTGDPLFSIHHTDALALALARERPLTDLPWLMARLLWEAAKPPVVILGAVGLALAWHLRRRDLVLPAVLMVLTGVSYLVIAAGGLATVYRYLLPMMLALIVFATFALTGWTAMERGPALRRGWLAVSTAALALGLIYTGLRIHPANAEAQLRERVTQRADLVAVLTAPASTRFRDCGPLTVPNHKLIPEVRTLLDLPARGVIARSDTARPRPTSGIAVVIYRGIENRPSLNVHEVPTDARDINLPPAAFGLVTATRRFTTWGSCPTR